MNISPLYRAIIEISVGKWSALGNLRLPEFSNRLIDIPVAVSRVGMNPPDCIGKTRPAQHLFNKVRPLRSVDCGLD